MGKKNFCDQFWKEFLEEFCYISRNYNQLSSNKRLDPNKRPSLSISSPKTGRLFEQEEKNVLVINFKGNFWRNFVILVEITTN